MIQKLVCCCIGIFMLMPKGWAFRIDTLQVESPKMQKKVEVIVIVPDKALQGEACPTLYLLHGHGNDAYGWLKAKPELPQMVDQDAIVVVCPDGEKSWYWDSPVNPKCQYETFVSSELVKYIDANYTTIQDRKGRAIAGLSMGGHGAMWISIRHKDIFGAAGSTSGGLDIRPFPESWNIKEIIGEESQHPEAWEEHTVINQIDKINNGDLSLIIDCGIDDFFLDVNRKFHEALLKRGIYHDFIIRPGIHFETYWNNSIDYQWLFFKKYFDGFRDSQVYVR